MIMKIRKMIRITTMIVGKMVLMMVIMMMKIRKMITITMILMITLTMMVVIRTTLELKKHYF